MARDELALDHPIHERRRGGQAHGELLREIADPHGLATADDRQGAQLCEGEVRRAPPRPRRGHDLAPLAEEAGDLGLSVGASRARGGHRRDTLHGPNYLWNANHLTFGGVDTAFG